LTRAGFTRGHSQLLPSDLAPVLQYGSGPSSDFLAKILGVNTPHFFHITQFYFPLSSLLLHKSHKRQNPYIVCSSSVRSMLAYGVANLGPVLNEVSFFLLLLPTCR
jgi:hypothetical protein